jgi:hypothetical protein
VKGWSHRAAIGRWSALLLFAAGMQTLLFAEDSRGGDGNRRRRMGRPSDAVSPLSATFSRTSQAVCSE